MNKVWTCKIVIPENTELPDGFDSPPRMAALRAVERAGIKVLSCFSGWGGKLTPTEAKLVKMVAMASRRAKKTTGRPRNNP